MQNLQLAFERASQQKATHLVLMDNKHQQANLMQMNLVQFSLYVCVCVCGQANSSIASHFHLLFKLQNRYLIIIIIWISEFCLLSQELLCKIGSFGQVGVSSLEITVPLLLRASEYFYGSYCSTVKLNFARLVSQTKLPMPIRVFLADKNWIRNIRFGTRVPSDKWLTFSGLNCGLISSIFQ